MSTEWKIIWTVVAGVGVVLAAMLLLPKAADLLAPNPVGALIAVEVQGTGVAVAEEVVEVEAGIPFTLHAVLEARARNGSTVYYTRAPGLRIRGKEIPPQALRPWTRRQEVRVLWFTVEGSRPYLPLEGKEDLDRFRVTEYFRAGWPLTWSIPGVLDPAHDDHLVRDVEPGPHPFGTQRYMVRIELYGSGSSLIPEARYGSPGAEALAQDWREFPTVVASLPEPLTRASRVFGLTQIEPPPRPLDAELVARLRDLTLRRLAFSGQQVLGGHLAAAGKAWEEVRWQRLSLNQGPRWNQEIWPGDLLQAGHRTVILYRDEGLPGVLDPDDLALDFAAGAAVVRLRQAFPQTQEVEWAAVAARGEARP